MKDLLTAAGAMAAIILLEMVLSRVFTDQAGKLFCEAALAALFFYCVGRALKREREDT